MASHDEKQKLYQMIVSRVSDWRLLYHMKQYGFWPKSEDLPPDPPDEVAERAELQKRINELRREFSIAKDPDKALAEERKRRMAESKKRRAEKKAEKASLADERRKQWAVRCAGDIVSLGEGVSEGLADRASDEARLAENRLPVLHDGAQLAAAIGIPLAALRWLTYHRRGATIVHYRRYEIAKRTGGMRSISAPKPLLARAQQWVQDNILSRVAPQPQAHGFVPGHSILTNAHPHAARQFVVNMDLKDFFPSITFRRVKGLFHRMGYSEHVATVLALLTTEPPRTAAELDGKVYHIALGQRVLPQGACTSPAITNLLCRRLDKRLTGLAAKLGLAYTRYADDLTFSGDDKKRPGFLLKCVRSVIAAEGFTEHPRKTRVMRKAGRQEVTGLIVNSGKASLPRESRRQLRAILHNAAKHGLSAANKTNRPRFAQYLRGKVAFAAMIDPQRADEWRGMLKQALANDFAPKEPVVKPSGKQPRMPVFKNAAAAASGATATQGVASPAGATKAPAVPPALPKKSTADSPPSSGVDETKKKWWQFWK